MRRDGPGARRFAGWDRPAREPVPPQKPIRRQEVVKNFSPPPGPLQGPCKDSSNPRVEPVPKSVPAGWPRAGDLTVAAEVTYRSRGRCEARLDGCAGDASHRHHRKLRRFGDHRAVNLAHLCHACHDWIHGHVAWATRWGWLLRGSDDPEVVPQGVERADLD